MTFWTCVRRKRRVLVTQTKIGATIPQVRVLPNALPPRPGFEKKPIPNHVSRRRAVRINYTEIIRKKLKPFVRIIFYSF